ncbi:hypothetical protein Klosneuvirus_4_38 [Klosneuvirus KNV1]|uniref:Uncharacterized protein n=1 Tax=Klosneuvirus KNV1 TaxID=1977640 RepID=A0A1V0SKI8_9VIRU|nr:hypothetical protein Klosneuvirus_4_38 [Klosneuvirus KNV1]
MDNQILGVNRNVVYTLIVLLALIILGIVTFHYYAYLTAGSGSALSAGAGMGFAFMPKRDEKQN